MVPGGIRRLAALTSCLSLFAIASPAGGAPAVFAAESVRAAQSTPAPQSAPAAQFAETHTPGETRLLRMPAVSERHIAFVYANDIWVVSRGGALMAGHFRETHLRLSAGSRQAPETGQAAQDAQAAQGDGAATGRQPAERAAQGAEPAAASARAPSTDPHDLPAATARRLTTSPGAEINPRFSPDGQWIAFSGQYGGNTDVYVVPVEGGEPRRLTWHPGADVVQGWTPDGSAVVFRSGREGHPTAQTRFFTVPLEGGFPTALPIPRGEAGSISPDGAFMAYQVPTYWDPEWRNHRGGHAMPIWVVSLDDYELIKVPWTGERQMTPVWVGEEVFFLSERDWANNIWSFNPRTGELRQRTFHTDFDVKNLDAWTEPEEARRAREASQRERQEAAGMSVGHRSDGWQSSVIVYEQAGALHLLDPALPLDDPSVEPRSATVPTNPQRVTIAVRGDQIQALPRWVTVQPTQLQTPSLSPTGQRALFSFRGEVLTVPAEHGDWRNLTGTSGVAERDPAWSPRGDEIAYFSDEWGEYRLVIAPQDGGIGAVAAGNRGGGAGANNRGGAGAAAGSGSAGSAGPTAAGTATGSATAPDSRRVISLPDPTFFFGPRWSPDARYIAYRDAGMRLWYVELESGDAVHVDTERHAYPERSLDPTWSPDSRWLAYTRRLDSHLRAVFVHDVTTGETRQLTDGLSDAYKPQWDASGKYLYFLASTDFGLNTGWLDMSSFDRPITRGVYLAVLADDEPSPLAPRSDEEPGPGANANNGNNANGNNGDANNGNGGSGAGSANNAANANRGNAGAGAPNARGTGTGSATDSPPTVRIDFEGIDQRILALPVPQRNYLGLIAAEAGTVFYLEPAPATGVATPQPGPPDFTLRRYRLEEREADEFLSPVQSATVSHDGKKLLVRSGAQWRIVNTAGPPPGGNNGQLSLAGMQVRVDPQEEWRQMFREGWRIQRDFLYVENFHGAPWDEIRDWYEPWLEHVRHRSDLTYLLGHMGGEIAVGHSYVGGGDVATVDGVAPGLLGADLEEGEGGRYRIARIYRGENWNPGLQAPLSGPGIDVTEGDYLLAVNGRALEAPTNPFSLLEGTAGRQTVLTVNDRPTTDGARQVTVVPVAGEGALRMRAWMEGNRKKVDELSGGRLAYVWLPNTSTQGYTNFNRYYFAQQDREGAVIDERDNGGGSAADYIVDVLARELQGYFNSPVGDRKPFTQPIAGLFGPKVMIINESAGSGGDLMPFLFRQREIGPLVGTRTWGGLVGIWDSPSLIDGGFMLAPRGGFFNLDGEWDVENVGVSPDIEVEMTPREVIEGRDPQLERAVEEGLRLLETEGVELRGEPVPPVRWRRPG